MYSTNKEIDEKAKKIIKVISAKSIKETFEYDVKREFLLEIGLIDKLDKESTNLEEFKRYKSKSNLDIDCDVCLRSILIYQIAWDFLNGSDIKLQDKYNTLDKKYELVKNKTTYRGDAMTSASTTFYEYLNVVKLDMKELPENVNDFLKFAYTCGNFIPVPLHFNSERSGFKDRKAEWDYWDLTLQCIYKWYEDNLRCLSLNNTNDAALESLFSRMKYHCYLDKSISDCKNWLYIFGTWNNFIKLNFLQDFVYIGESGKEYGSPIMFWDNHSFDKPLPKRKEEFEKFFDTVNEMIRKRGKRISEKVHNTITIKQK